MSSSFFITIGIFALALYPSLNELFKSSLAKRISERQLKITIEIGEIETEIFDARVKNPHWWDQSPEARVLRERLEKLRCEQSALAEEVLRYI